MGGGGGSELCLTADLSSGNGLHTPQGRPDGGGDGAVVAMVTVAVPGDGSGPW